MSEIKGRYGYFPGCSLVTSAHAYQESIDQVCQTLGLGLDEIDDWNCCGATEYISLSQLPAYALIARNLALAADQRAHEVVAPCSLCYLHLHRVNDYMGKHPDINDRVNRALAAGDLRYEPGTVEVRNLLDVLVDDVGYEAIAEKVTQPLKGLRVAPYYGCLVVRPKIDGQNPEYPTHMDKLLAALGATVVDFPLKTHCCGGHMTQISEETAYELMRRILHNAAEYRADAIVTVCPMCQLNLDAFQPQVNGMFGTNFKLPVLFFTQLMGLAFGIAADKLGFGSELTSAKAALEKIGHEEPEAAPKRRDKKALPMPPAP